jgi:hypothetical protein
MGRSSFPEEVQMSARVLTLESQQLLKPQNSWIIRGILREIRFVEFVGYRIKD